MWQAIWFGTFWLVLFHLLMRQVWGDVIIRTFYKVPPLHILQGLSKMELGQARMFILWGNFFFQTLISCISWSIGICSEALPSLCRCFWLIIFRHKLMSLGTSYFLLQNTEYPCVAWTWRIQGLGTDSLCPQDSPGWQGHISWCLQRPQMKLTIEVWIKYVRSLEICLCRTNHIGLSKFYNLNLKECM